VARSVAVAWALALVAAAAPRDARAGEAEAARWKAAAAAFPEPGAEKGFDWAYEMVHLEKDLSVGLSGRLAAAPGTDEEKPAWVTEEVRDLPSLKTRARHTHSRALATIRGESKTEGSSREHVALGPSRDGLAVSVQKGDKPAVETTLTGPVLAGGNAEMLLAVRLLPSDAAVYEVKTMTAEGAPEAVTITVKGTQAWSFRGTTRDAFVAEVRRANGHRTRIVLDPATRDPLAMEFVGQRMAFVPKGAGAAPTVDLSKPATTPQVAAVRAAVGFASGDAQLIADAIHWPSFQAADPAEGAKSKSPEEYRKATLARLQERKSGDRATVEPDHVKVLGKLDTTKRTDGRVVVTFPQSFGGFSLVTAEHDGAWYVVEIPED
jgi:hypothetical protein